MTDMLADFVFELLVDDELQMARLLRKKLLNKQEEKLKKLSTNSSFSSSSIGTQTIKTTNNSLANTIAHSLTRSSFEDYLLFLIKN